MDVERLKKLVEHANNAPVKRIDNLDLQLGDSMALSVALEGWLLIEQLRAPEGATVTLICDNPDFNGQPNCAVEIVDDWTAWKTVRFTGDTMLDALRKAQAAGHAARPR